ncbi:MAG: hypothetical protein M1833_005813 [Piccolia ochrophora]|nr:MAG: hypothetical protein M1833_005813 [Piccolia ochrophora]
MGGRKKPVKLLVLSSDSEPDDYAHNFEETINVLPPRARASSRIHRSSAKGAVRNNEEISVASAMVGTAIGDDAQADDEEEEDPIAEDKQRRRSNRQRTIEKRDQESKSPLGSRPPGRLWFSAVKAIFVDYGTDDSSQVTSGETRTPSGSTAARKLPVRTSPRSGTSRQSSISNFFSKADAVPNKTSERLKAPQSAERPSEATHYATDAASEDAALAADTERHGLTNGRSNAPRRPSRLRQSILFRQDPSTTVTSEEDDSNSNKTASSQTSSFIDEYEEPVSSAADSMSDSASEAVPSTADDVEDSDDVVETVAARPPPAKRFKLGYASVPEKVSAKAKNAQVQKRNKDSWTYKSGIDESLKPLHDIEEIFDDMTAKAVNQGLLDTIQRLNGRKLKIATMCSGTESPILALQLVGESLRKYHDSDLGLEHQFSAEIVPYKQAYIERNFSPPIIFRDIRELVDSTEATTAYGATVDIPGDVDVLVAGFSCVDFSNLNGKKQTIDDNGESGNTFRAVFNYTLTWRPALVILENVCSAPWERLQKAFETTADYSAQFIKLDTKQYYLPHTRQRGYMMCVDNRKIKGANRVAQRWLELMKSTFKRPASSSIEAFLLHEDDPRVHRGREEMSKGNFGDDKGPREVDWTKCQGRHQDYRQDLFLGTKRPMTGWADNGSCKMPDYAWGDWGTAQVERIWDTLEISLLRNVRRGFDSQFKTRVWELSQNIDRFVDTTGFGITNCITPTGQPYVTNRGGPLVGLEALSMQGLPIEKLLLTRESQKQLQDLAGNAMSSTVVGAALLSALIAGAKVLKQGTGDAMLLDEPDTAHASIGPEAHLDVHSLDLAKACNASVPSVLADAARSSRLCQCEGRDLMTSLDLKRCTLCDHTACVKCAGTPVHSYALLSKAETEARIAPAVFEHRLKDALPMRMSLTGLSLEAMEGLRDACTTQPAKKDWASFVSAVEPALNAELRFHSVHRAKSWTVLYDSPASKLELLLDSRYAEWRVYAKVNPSEAGNSHVRQMLSRPFARMRPSKQHLLDGKWQFCVPVAKTYRVQFEGYGKQVRSWESRLGLQEEHFKDRKMWTDLRVSLQDSDVSELDLNISGDYKFLPDCGTASGALHIRQKAGEVVPLCLFLDPSRLGDPKEDHFVFSTDPRRLNYGELRPIVATVSASWRPSNESGTQSAACHIQGQWTACNAVALEALGTQTRATFATPPKDVEIALTPESCVSADAMLSCKVNLGDIQHEQSTHWKQGSWREVAKMNERSFYSSFAWLTERVKHIPGLDEWKQLQLPMDAGRCKRCAPSQPAVKWKLHNGKLMPYEDPQQAGPYERALKDRPAPFITRVRIDEDNVGHLQVGLNVTSLVHKAAANLSMVPDEHSTDLKLAWRLCTDYVIPPSASLEKLRLRSNKADPESKQPPRFKYKLRPEQLRSLHWMRQQESEHAEPYTEEEVEEALLPQLGWRAEGRALRSTPVRGGVLADQVGYGKTATTLGLIDSQRERRKQNLPTPKDGRISIKATLIVVPVTLTAQWARETEKFLGKAYKTLVIKNVMALSKTTIQDFEDADIIIVAWTIFNNETYLNKLAHFAALPEMPSNSGRAFDAWFDFALSRLTDHVDQLRNTNPRDFYETLKQRFISTEQDESFVENVPSKRLRGAAYAAAQTATSAAPTGKKQGGKGKRKADELESSNATTPAQITKSYTDVFSFKSKTVASDWKRMPCPLFHMFHFGRLIVDEYTYLEGKNHTCITKLLAPTRWVLSGTPPLGDFADVKTIAVFLGINLGIDDDAIGVLKGQNIKNIQRDRTAAEKFQAFKQHRSPAWHSHRQEIAQRFLDQFVRQNIAEIDEIPSTLHIRAVKLPAAERAIYLELNQHLMSQDMKIRKGRSRAENDRERRMNQTLGDSKTPEEALIKRCSHFTLDELRKGNENASQACDVLVSTRQFQLDDLLLDLQKNLKHAVWLRKHCDDQVHYDSWKDKVGENIYGDAGATVDLVNMINAAEASYRKSDEGLFYKDALVKKKKKVQSGKAVEGSSMTKKGKKKPKAVASDDSDIVMDSDDSELDDGRRPRLENKNDVAQMLRELTSHLQRLSRELISRQRSLRYIKRVRGLQMANSGLKASSDCLICSNCGKEKEPHLMSVLSLCGHAACDKCLEKKYGSDECVVSQCDAAARFFHIAKASELGEEDSETINGRHYGRKLGEVMTLIKTEIPASDQVLLFVQFDDLMEKVATALEENGIEHWALTRSMQTKAASCMTDFQTNESDKKKKVLVLNVADESASGANLTNANHIIFLSPLLTDSQYRYDSSMTQAIGRARRYGQNKVVHVYHFLSLKTIDVDILENKSRKKLVRVDESYELRKESDIDPDAMDTLGSGPAQKGHDASDHERLSGAEV